MNERKILIYNLKDNERKELIFRFLKDNNIEIIEVNKDAYYNSLASLLNVPNFNKNIIINTKEDINDEMLVMYNFDEQLLNTFLSYFKNNNISSIKLKALITPTNLYWNSLELYKELIKEHEYYQNK